MKQILVAIFLIAAFVGMPMQQVHAADGKRYSKRYKKKRTRPLRGRIYMNRRGRRIGGYSYRYVDVMNSRRQAERIMRHQSRIGSLDDDFFYERPRGPFGGNTPYMH